ncbi:flagellar basal body-associated FliL family protein [Paracoccus jeotgali]|uniref:Flagellar protein FliL n=1 Tax=Paracoccus jeotgali TaxID=2065379 RepID=A0A2K9MGQ7_9RHOB|nr:flagellar basal body-associated FliL family protein [Paracoccus jeotgali]AUM74790.1 flagellar basal body protein FliL [Paracoccus jeotgali]
MTDITPAETAPKPSRRGMLVVAALILAVGAGGGAMGFLGVVSPSRLLAPKPAAVSLPQVGFADVPRIVVPISGRDRQLALSIKLEVAPEELARVELLMPRLSDSFTGFLSDIDAAAIERRGVLEIIRAELAARADMILGAGVVKNVLITEFAVQ